MSKILQHVIKGAEALAFFTGEANMQPRVDEGNRQFIEKAKEQYVEAVSRGEDPPPVGEWAPMPLPYEVRRLYGEGETILGHSYVKSIASGEQEIPEIDTIRIVVDGLDVSTREQLHYEIGARVHGETRCDDAFVDAMVAKLQGHGALVDYEREDGTTGKLMIVPIGFRYLVDDVNASMARPVAL